MSATNQSTDLSTANFTAIFDAASNEYKTLTKQDLETHPFAAAFENSDSPDSVMDVFRKQSQAFDKFRKGDDKLMAWLTPIVNILLTFSGTLGEGIGLPFSPAKTIFTGIGVLLGVVKDVMASYEALVKLFERIQLFFQRLHHYTSVTLTPEMTELLAKVMAQTLSILALSTKAMKENRTRNFMKRLMGQTEVDDAFERLDMLTQEENLMAVAGTFETTHRVDVNVKTTQELTQHVDTVLQQVDGNVKATQQLTHHIDNNVMEIQELTCNVHADVEVIKEGTRTIDDNIRDTKSGIDALQRNQSRSELRRWLAPTNPSVNHNTACDTHHDGTAEWFIRGRTFDEWKTNGSLLWIRGNPGSGKSILCSAIIEEIKHIRKSRSALVAYYYFDFKDAAKRDVRGLLTSLLLQLVDDSDPCWTLLSQLHKICRDGSEQASEAALAQCLNSMLDLPGQIPTYIIIDALDECPNNTGTPSAREKVLKFIEDLVESNHSNLFICITSRPEQDINTALNPLTSPSRRVSLHEESGQMKDINSFVHSFVMNDRTMRRWRAEDKELVICVLSERAQGMFRWVYCQLDTLRRCMPSSIRKALNELPITLDDTYERILQGIPKEKFQHARRLFQCVVAAIRPLRVKELAEIFAINFGPNEVTNFVEGWRPEDPEEAVLSACSSLIAIIDDKGSKIVQFSHFSVKEYMTSDRLQTSDIGYICDYYIPLEPAHTVLARACMAVLLQLDEKVDWEQVATYPLAEYASKCWLDHAKFENVQSQIEDDLKHLFDPKRSHLRACIWMRNVEVEYTYSSIHSAAWRPPPLKATPLYYAVFCGFSELAKWLITTHGEDVNARCYNYKTPLHVASWEGHVDALEVLLDYGAYVNSQDYMGWMPLHFASYMGNLGVAQLLLEHEATLNARTNAGRTPVFLASRVGCRVVVRLLLSHGADVHIPGAHIPGMLPRAETSVHIPGMHTSVPINVSFETPFKSATAAGYHEIAQLLLEHGAKRE